MAEHARAGAAGDRDRPGFLHTLPGLLTASVSIIGACIVLMVGVVQFGALHGRTGGYSAPPVAPVLEVVSATVRVDPARYDGRCPTPILISADLHLSGEAGIVQYRWHWAKRDDTEIAQIHVQQGDTVRTVTTEVSLGGPGPENSHVGDAVTSDMVTVETISPTNLTAPSASVEVTCR